VFGFDHAELGAAIADDWNFPLQLVASAALHHTPGTPGLAGLVAVADRLALANGLAPGFETPRTLAPLQPEFEALERAGAGFVPLLDRSRAFVESVCGQPLRWRAAA